MKVQQADILLLLFVFWCVKKFFYMLILLWTYVKKTIDLWTIRLLHKQSDDCHLMWFRSCLRLMISQAISIDTFFDRFNKKKKKNLVWETKQIIYSMSFYMIMFITRLLQRNNKHLFTWSPLFSHNSMIYSGANNHSCDIPVVLCLRFKKIHAMKRCDHMIDMTKWKNALGRIIINVCINTNSK
jgi:hypothetical protein